MRKRFSPDEQLDQILERLKTLPHAVSDPDFGELACGNLESLLGFNGNAIIDRVELEAQANPAFRLLLGGVWQHGMSNELWQRVQRLQDHTGWNDPA